MTFWIALFLLISFLTTLALLGALALSKRTINESPVVDEEPIMSLHEEPLHEGAAWQLRTRNLNS